MESLAPAGILSIQHRPTICRSFASEPDTAIVVSGDGIIVELGACPQRFLYPLENDLSFDPIFVTFPLPTNDWSTSRPTSSIRGEPGNPQF